MKVNWSKAKKYLTTGQSHMIPLTVIGGIFYAASIAFGGTSVAGQGMVVTNQFLLNIQKIGEAGLFMMIPVLCAYIAYGIAGKPALAPGFVAGYLCNTEIMVGDNGVKTGFLGALVLGYLTGFVVKYLKKVHYPDLIKTVVPILILPVAAAFAVCIAYIYILAVPMGAVMNGLTVFLNGLSGGSKLVLGLVLGALVAFDMGGPVNKAACLFAIAMMSEGNYEFFGICAVPICTCALGMGLATLLSGKLYSQEERDAGKAALFMGLIGISEGAIPLAVADPLHVIPSIMTGGAVGGAIAALGGVKDFAPHGGPIVLPIVEGKAMFILAIVAGTIVTALMANFLKYRKSVRDQKKSGIGDAAKEEAAVRNQTAAAVE